MGGICSLLNNKKEIDRLREKMALVEARTNANSNEIQSTNIRIEEIAISVSVVENALGLLSTRFDDFYQNMENSTKRNEDCLDLLKEETPKHVEHRLRIERMMHDMANQRNNHMTRDQWIGKIPRAIYNTLVDEMIILHVKTCMSARHLKMIGRHLGLTNAVIYEIEVDCKSHSAEEAYQILLKWKNKQGQQAKVKNLIAGFFQAAREDPDSINVVSLKDALLMTRDPY